MHLLTGILIIPWITLVTKGHALVCYGCHPEMGQTGERSDCNNCELISCDEQQKCHALTVKLEAKEMECSKYCIDADEPCGSVNMGVIYYREDCCSTDKCNLNFTQPPDKLPANGLECYTCKDNNCTNVLQCTGHDDHCINGTVKIGGVVLTGKGCASENMCVDLNGATCCKENWCNGERIHPTGDTSGRNVALRVSLILAVIIAVIGIGIGIAYYLSRSILDHLFNNDNEKKFPPEYILPHTYKDMQVSDMQPVMTKGVSRDQGSGSQETTGDQGVHRELNIQRSTLSAAAVCLVLLCFLLVLITLYYHSANNRTALTLEINLLKADYTNLMLQRNQLQHELKKEKEFLAAGGGADASGEAESETVVVQADIQLPRSPNLLCESVKSCPSGWQQFGGSCYYRSTTWKTWEESRQQCQKTPGADLVVIDSKEEQEFIRGLNDESSSWIGLKRTQGRWTWLNGTPLTTQYWDRGYPDENQGNWNCARYWHSNGKWSSGVCSVTVKSICEKK